MYTISAKAERSACSMNTVTGALIYKSAFHEPVSFVTWLSSVSMWWFFTWVQGRQASQLVLVLKNPPASAGDIKDMGVILGLGRSLGGGHGNPLQYSCLENPMDRGAWWATIHRVTKSQTQLKWLSTHACTRADVQIQRKTGKENKISGIHFSFCVYLSFGFILIVSMEGSTPGLLVHSLQYGTLPPSRCLLQLVTCLSTSSVLFVFCLFLIKLGSPLKKHWANNSLWKMKPLH